MLEVFKEFRLYCAHSVQAFGPDNKCSKKHGHCYKIRVGVEYAGKLVNGVSIPFDVIEKAWNQIGLPLDHTDLNETFGENASTEVLAVYLQSGLQSILQLPTSVEVRETESSGVYIR